MLQSSLEKKTAKKVDIDVVLNVILLNFGVFAARGVPPDPPGEVKGKVKKIKTGIFNKVDVSQIIDICVV